MNHRKAAETASLPAARWVAVLVAVWSLAGCDLMGQPKPKDRYVPPPQVTHFESLYEQNCAGCHGKKGRLGPAPPHNDPLFLEIVPEAELLRTITEGRRGTPMPAFASDKGGTLTAEQVRILANGIKTNPDWKRTDTKLPADVPSYLDKDSKGTKTTSQLEEIRHTVFARACGTCHGERGQGGKYDGRSVGAINDPAFLELTSDQALRRYVITGRPDLGMPNFAEATGRAPDFKPLTSQEVADLVALLASWRQAGATK